MRLHTAGEFQVFVEGGAGVGHLIRLSADDLFENPAQQGRGGGAYRLGGGGRWFVWRQVAIGLDLTWTKWSNVARPAFIYGADRIPARSDLAVSAILVQLSVGWSSRR